MVAAPVIDPQREIEIAARLERALVAQLVFEPARFGELPREFGLDVLADLQAQHAFQALANLHHRGDRIDAATVRAELERGTGHADHGWFDQLVAIAPGPVPIAGRARSIIAAAQRRHAAIASADEAARAEAELDEFALRDAEPRHTETAVVAAPAPSPAPWRRCRDDVATIIARAREPWCPLTLGSDEIVSVRAGGTVVLVGPTGRGKTSLALSLLVEHARDRGPAIAVSLELPADELSSRAIGLRTDAAWASVLRGEVREEWMYDALPERLVRIDRDRATIAALARTIDDVRELYPAEPILVALDYVQLLGADDATEIRPRIGRVMRDIDRVARDRRVVVIALSQGSRQASRALSSGERIGADTTDAGAESADLERWATVTLAIGTLGTESEDGTAPAELSLGKSRMGGGDRVIPARYCGRSGLWRLAGEARPAAEVRAERVDAKSSAKQETAELAMTAWAERAKEPFSREDIKRKGGSKAIASAALEVLLDKGVLVEVRQKVPRSRAWLLWTPVAAEKAGIPLVNGGRE